MTCFLGRPPPVTELRNLPVEGRARILLKREDLVHGGAHKGNQVLGQALLAKRMGKRRIIAETGAGQHGTATAMVCMGQVFLPTMFDPRLWDAVDSRIKAHLRRRNKSNAAEEGSQTTYTFGNLHVDLDAYSIIGCVPFRWFITVAPPMSTAMRIRQKPKISTPERGTCLFRREACQRLF